MRTAVLVGLAFLLATGAVAQSSSEPAPVKKDPFVAGAFGALVPGGGHFYAGETRRGAVLAGIGATATGLQIGALQQCGFLKDGQPKKTLCDAQAIFLVVGVMNLFYSIGDGRRAAIRYNEALQVSAGPAKVRPIASAHGGRPSYGLGLRVAL